MKKVLCVLKSSQALPGLVGVLVLVLGVVVTAHGIETAMHVVRAVVVV